MKRYLYVLIAISVLAAAGYFWIQQRKHDIEERMRSEIRQIEDQHRQKLAQEGDTKRAIDLHVLYAGDTILVAACSKSFFVNRTGLTGAHAGPSIPGGYLSIDQGDSLRFEFKFSCESIKHAAGIYPIVFTNERGIEKTVFFIPASDLDGQLRYYSNFEVR